MTQQATLNQRMLLKQRPNGMVTHQDVVPAQVPIGSAGPGQMLIRNYYLSLDPAIRDWMSGRLTYVAPIPLNEVMRGTVVGKVLQSQHPDFSAGQWVVGIGGWEHYSVVEGDHFKHIDKQPTDQLQHFLSVYGAVGLTPYFGLLKVGKPQAGETVLISAAAGAVGSLAGQIAKILGCRAVGIAGTEAKCRQLVEEFGYDEAINYRQEPDMAKAIARACPEGVDVYFDNVGGEILDATLLNLNKFARVIFCGAISTYNMQGPVPGPFNYWQILARSATVTGYLCSDYFDEFPQGIAQMRQWVQEGRLVFKEQIIDGLENALEAFNLLFSGENEGKLIVRL